MPAKERHTPVIVPGPDDRIYPVAKLADIVAALATQSVFAKDALSGVGLSEAELRSAATRVSLHQVLEGYRNAARLSHDPGFAYRAGLRLHVTAYGLYGFAILCSVEFRQSVQFALQYYQLATPVADVAFEEENRLGIFKVTPAPHPRIDARLYRFIVELSFGNIVTLIRDGMGAAFSPRELHVTYGANADVATYADIFGCPVLFHQPENRLLFDAAWLDAKPKFGNEISYEAVVELCNGLLEEIDLRIGLAGKVRRILMANLMRPMRFEEVASRLGMGARTLRRDLRSANTSFRKLVDELRRSIAIKLLRDTELTVEDVASLMGFSEAAAFRHAFRRWTNMMPHEFREVSGS
jgi:AraC-like DNA-binding protein